MIRAVFFDVDFTLIYPGPAFQGEGYREFCAKHGMSVNADRFPAAVSSASALLDAAQDAPYTAQLFIDYTAHVIGQMGGRGPTVAVCAREIYDEWAACRHFRLYEDVPETLHMLVQRGIRIGLISNSHRCLDSFQTHFDLQGLIDVALSSPEHGFMKPHPSIFEAALKLAGVEAAESLMVGDSLRQDIDGARRAGMRGVLVRRSESMASEHEAIEGVPVIGSLLELSDLL